MRKHLPFFLAALVPFLLLAGMAADQVRVVASGARVLVPVVPVDPMSLFSGEYARLSFEFSRMDEERLAALGFRYDATPLRKGDRVWIVLSPDAEGSWHPVRLSVTPATPVPGKEVSIRGEVRHFHAFQAPVYDNVTKRRTGEKKRHALLEIRTGLESFFVPQGEAESIERAARKGGVSAEIAVLPGGRAAVRALFAGRREIRF